MSQMFTSGLTVERSVRWAEEDSNGHHQVVTSVFSYCYEPKGQTSNEVQVLICYVISNQITGHTELIST